MKILPNILAIGWALLILGSLFLTYMMPAGSDPVARAWDRIEVFLTWQGTALLVALIAAGLAFVRKEKRSGQGWWMGYGPLIGTGFIAAIVGLAALTYKLL